MFVVGIIIGFCFGAAIGILGTLHAFRKDRKANKIVRDIVQDIRKTDPCYTGHPLPYIPPECIECYRGP